MKATTQQHLIAGRDPLLTVFLDESVGGDKNRLVRRVGADEYSAYAYLARLAHAIAKATLDFRTYPFQQELAR